MDGNPLAAFQMIILETDYTPNFANTYVSVIINQFLIYQWQLAKLRRWEAQNLY